MTTMSPAATNFAAQMHLFTDSGLTGLVDNAVDANKLGELLATGHIDPESLRRLVLKYQPLVRGEGVDPRSYESMFWSKILGKPVEVPPLPHLRPKTVVAICEYKFAVIFLPAISETEYPYDFIKPKWRQYYCQPRIKRWPLPGRWVLVETIKKPDWNEPGGYGIGDADPLARALGLETRFGHSWDVLTETYLPKAAGILGVPENSTRHPSAEEWNLVANRLNWLRTKQNEPWPDQGSTHSREWCENACKYDGRVVIGHATYDGLANVHGLQRDKVDADIGFRVLVVL